jgi:hypothetical protein
MTTKRLQLQTQIHNHFSLAEQGRDAGSAARGDVDRAIVDLVQSLLHEGQQVLTAQICHRGTISLLDDEQSSRELTPLYAAPGP